MKNLKYESYEIQNLILNTIYYCILRGKPPFIPYQPLKLNSLEIFSSFLEPHIPAKLKITTEKCIMSLCVYNDAKAIACGLINKLVKLLINRKREVRTNAAGALMNISINDDAKKLLSSTNALSYLLDLLKDDHQDAILYSLKTLTNMSEDYTSRNQLIHKLDEIEIFLDNSNPHIVNAAKQALRTINWKP
ncbi:hypothetical protein BCR36DRAFT_587804 [Piromyces finnis]|uniref:ARM repeat-containing protein n=1 Tax=Piromyces finnis TaxID=1754191 RepID=A0A1Y1UUP4_9FUNG|nr:hypothetical protein BCR36DRAFT_587804 [Piromyces finnis]|eukprot:ORX41691.1 hypothetical protein BCR36DRAFT_587804 [Piromyces finnis]